MSILLNSPHYIVGTSTVPVQESIREHCYVFVLNTYKTSDFCSLDSQYDEGAEGIQGLCMDSIDDS